MTYLKFDESTDHGMDDFLKAQIEALQQASKDPSQPLKDLETMQYPVPPTVPVHGFRKVQKKVHFADETQYSDFAHFQAQIVDTTIPDDKRAIIKSVHNKYMGHHGITRTIFLLRKAGHYWPKMRTNVCQFIHTCPTCQKFWRHAPKPQLSYRTLDVYEPFQCCSSDWMGPFPEDDKGNKYIHVIVDSASRKACLFPHDAQNAKNAAEDFLKVFAAYAVCEYIHSDNGSYYTGELISEFTAMLGVDHIKITPYRHESNGQVEVFNRETLRHLRAIVFDRDLQRKWSMICLPLVESVLSNAPNAVTGISPNQYLFGNLFTHNNTTYNNICNKTNLKTHNYSILSLSYASLCTST
jgi:transposase InsO family protein